MSNFSCLPLTANFPIDLPCAIVHSLAPMAHGIFAFGNRAWPGSRGSGALPGLASFFW